MTEFFGSQVRTSSGAELSFTSPQGRKFSAGILAIWPTGKESSHRAAFSPEEKHEQDEKRNGWDLNQTESLKAKNTSEMKKILNRSNRLDAEP